MEVEREVMDESWYRELMKMLLSHGDDYANGGQP